VSVEILSVTLSPESIEALAQRVAQLLGQGQWPTTESNPGSSQNPQGANGPGSGQQGDPWMNQNGGQQQQAQQYQGPPNNQQQYQQGPPQGQQQGGGHNCAHGAMAFVPAGVNRNTNEPYNQYSREFCEHPEAESCENCWRGLLCHPCNRLLAHLRDAIEALRRAIRYLKSPPAQAWLMDKDD
jgi:hypothetical protein